MRSLRKFLIISALLIVALSVTALAYDIQGGTVVTSSAVNFRSGPSTEDDIIDHLYNEDRVAVLDEDGDFYKVAYKGVSGYLHKDYVELQPVMNIEAGGAKVTTAVLNMRSKPDIESDIITRLSEDTVAKIIGINSGWFKVTSGSYTGYIHPDYVTVTKYKAPVSSGSGSKSGGSVSASSAAKSSGSSGSSDLRDQIIDYAANYLGVKYVYGGSSPKGFDCSGFTQYVFANFDIPLSRTAASQYSSSVTKIKKSELNKGDLVFFYNNSYSKVGHVGIYVGDNQFIHSSSPGDVVKYDSLDSSYYSKHYCGAGTVF